MSFDHLTPLQSKLLEIFSWYHDFCTQHHLRYYAIGGTMLGAVRHQGFIPWDDDIDIGMPRSDYQRFCTLMQTQSPKDRFILETPYMNHHDFDYTYSKVYDTSTTLIELNKQRTKRGLFIDIFPIDGIGDDKKAALRSFRPIGIRLNLLAARVLEVRSGRSPLKNAAVLLSKLIPEFCYNTQKEILHIDQMCSAHDFDACVYGGNLVGTRRALEVMPLAYFGKPVEYNFEGIKIYGVERADDYLTHLYGDWRQLPPIEKQQSHHAFEFCDLNRSYLDD